MGPFLLRKVKNMSCIITEGVYDILSQDGDLHTDDTTRRPVFVQGRQQDSTISRTCCNDKNNFLSNIIDI